jgi:hypothetical protein
MGPGEVEFLGDDHGADAGGLGNHPGEDAHDSSDDEAALGGSPRRARWLVWALVAVLVLGGTGAWLRSTHHATPSATGSDAPTRPLPTRAHGLPPAPVDPSAGPVRGAGLAKARLTEACGNAVVQELSIMADAYRTARRHGASKPTGERRARKALRTVLVASPRPGSYSAVLHNWRINRARLLATPRRPVQISGVC